MPDQQHRRRHVARIHMGTYIESHQDDNDLRNRFYCGLRRKCENKLWCIYFILCVSGNNVSRPFGRMVSICRAYFGPFVVFFSGAMSMESEWIWKAC